MAEALILEFSGVKVDDYRAVNALLGIDADTGEGDWPAGLLNHIGATSDGGLVVFEVWDSQASQGAFMADRLGPALGKAGVSAPTRVEWLAVVGNHHTH
jgi:hypothetical protein